MAHPHSVRSRFLLALTTSAFVTSCGGPPGLGGGGGGSDKTLDKNDPGELSIAVEKSTMDSGDFNRVRIDMTDINEDGVLVKFRYPTSIKYSKGSAVFFPGEDDEYSITPYTEDTSGKDRYLVFFVTPDMALGRGSLPLELDLKAISPDEEAFVEVDLDKNDQKIDDQDEFRVSNPKFTALDHYSIEILDENSAKPSATPTPSK